MAELAVRERLDALIRDRGAGYASVSRLLGRNPAYIQQYIKRGVPRRLGEIERRLLAQHFGVPEYFLGGPEGKSAGAEELLQANAQPLRIPYLDPDSGIVPQPPQNMLAFDGATAARLCGGRIEALATLTVEGDSMFPTLVAGDQIIIDTAEKRGLRDGIYVIRTDDALLVKRLSVHPVTGKVAILSDNTAYPSVPDCDPARILVIGRVQWVGRHFG